MWIKLKQYLMVFIAGVGSILGILFLLNRNDDAKLTLEKDETLKDQDDQFNTDIDNIKTDIESIEETELSPDEVEDYWEKD